MATKLITATGGTLTSGHFCKMLKASMPDGILDGFDISVSGTTITMTPGHLAVCGNLVEVDDVTTASDTSGNGWLYAEIIPLAPATKARIRRIYGDRNWIRGDVTADNATSTTSYEMPLAKFTLQNGVVSVERVAALVGTHPQHTQSGVKISVQQSQPSNPSVGDLWFW